MVLRKRILACAMILNFSLAGSLALAETPMKEGSAGSLELSSDGPTKASTAPSHAVIPLGKVLPKNVVRARILGRSYEGDHGYDKDGNVSISGFKARTDVTGIVGEYGITDQLSFSFLLPYITRNQLALDQEQFLKSSLYKKNYEKMANGIADEFVKAGLCSSRDNCREMIDKGHLHLPEDSRIDLPSGESTTFSSKRPIKDQIEEFVLNAATPPLDGPTGIGDLELGLLFNAYKSESIILSSGLGLRLPTGNSNVTDMQRPISGRVHDAVLRLNADFSPSFAFWISMQQQFETALDSATWKRESMLDNAMFNEEDPSVGPKADGLANTRTYTKRGVKSDSLLKANFGFAALSPDLKAFAMNASYLYSHDRAIYLDSDMKTAASDLHIAGAGVTVSGLGYRIPVELELNYSQPIAGKNSNMAVAYGETQLKVYARF